MKNQFINWSFGEGEAVGSYNTVVIGAMSEAEFMKAPQFAHLFEMYSPAAKEIRMKALYAAVKEKNAKAAPAPAPEKDKK